MSEIIFDDNGNPMNQEDEEIDRVCDDDDEDACDDGKIENEKELNYENCKVKEGKVEETNEESTYFINAAAVSDEEGIEFMAGSRSGDTFTNEEKSATTSEAANENLATTSTARQSVPGKKNDESFVLFEKVNYKSRVPISRSYPDIIQTTMTEKIIRINNSTFQSNALAGRSNNSKEMRKESVPNTKLDFVPTDSLEELVESSLIMHSNQQEGEEKECLTASKILEPRFSLDGSLSSSMAGISAEKPPDSWTIDFNSLSIETLSDFEPKTSNSNSNSLAFFIDMNEPIPETAGNEAGKSSFEDPKKIFPLFIDIREQQKSAAENKLSTNRNSMIPEKISGGYGRNQPSMDTTYYTYKKPAASSGYKITSKSGTKLGYQPQQRKDQLMDTSSIGLRKELPMNSSTISNRSSLHVANHDLEDMFASSILSSMEASGEDEDMESCLKLGMDLLRMFQEGINTDVQISVRGRLIKAHKCILASRSQYFAALLSGNRIENSGNTIHLDEFTYSVVNFTLYHIYSGTNEIPDSIDLMELTSLTDLLGLEGLREIISHTFKVKFAHNFHRPCSTCIIGVIQFFPIAITYGMDDLSRKMTKWISKHFVRIWPTKAFASLGDDLIEKCLTYTINHLSGENLLDITLGCDQLINTMPNIKWAETIFSIVNQLTQACVQFLGENFCQVLQSQRFLVFGKGQSWNISRIEHTFMEGLQLLKPDEACLSHVCLTRLIELGTEAFDEVESSSAFVEFLNMLRNEVEKFLLANASRAVLSKNWERLGENVRRKICSTGFLGYDKSGNKKVESGKTSGRTALQSKSSSRPTSSTSSRAGAATGTKTSWKAGQQKSSQESQLLEPSPTSGQSSRQILSPTEKSAKVASVRPMPSQVQHQNVFSSRQTTLPESKSQTRISDRATAGNSSRSVLKSSAQSKLVRNSERERSFDASPTSSSSSFSNQAHSKPMTPVAARPMGFPRNSKLSPRLDDKPSTPTKPVFLTNSEKAKAVSKPPLKIRARSNSVTNNQTTVVSNTTSATHSRQSSIGSSSTIQPRAPNLAQPSRYASSLAAHRRPLEKIVQSTTASPRSPAPKPRVTSATSARKGNNATSSAGAKMANTSGEKSQRPAAQRKKGGTKLAPDFDSGSDSDLMTKSNIEVEVSSGEPKMRTLAEIGRSSTFSKDEPTVIGKIDFSLDMEYTDV